MTILPRLTSALAFAWLTVAVAHAQANAPAQAKATGRITGVGGVFVKSKDPKALSAWYRDMLGVQIEAFGGAMLRHDDAPGQPPFVVWRSFKQETTYMAPSTRDFMLNFTVDNLDAFVDRLTKKGVAILKRDEDPAGKYAWILDPDGTKIELWQPKPD